MAMIPYAVGICSNVNEAFRAIVEIAKNLKIDLNREVSTLVNGVLTIGGMVLGGLTAGPRGVVSGGLAGASIANRVMSNENFISLADYLLRQLPGSLKTSLVSFFTRLLAPFSNIEEAVKRITDSSSLVGKFKHIMESFLSQHDSSYHVC